MFYCIKMSMSFGYRTRCLARTSVVQVKIGLWTKPLKTCLTACKIK